MITTIIKTSSVSKKEMTRDVKFAKVFVICGTK
jgi:ribosome-binding factor A